MSLDVQRGPTGAIDGGEDEGGCSLCESLLFIRRR